MNIFKNYVDYLKDNPKGYWFKRKLYGWGWTPATKEGWIVTLLYILAILAFGLSLGSRTSDSEVFFMFILPVVLLTSAFIRIAYRKGEKPKWTWGTRDDSDNNGSKEER